MNRHPDFTNPGNLGMKVVRHDRYAVARRSVLAQRDVFRSFMCAGSERDASGRPGRAHTNSGLLLAEFQRLVSELPILSA
ncbi:MAG: hypothetical protein GTN89_01995 [Acidobacteria bacterium]|nr:hypothetical protein [Acidobacteriota bacterium]NIM61579.1 hypothetical protein [Acidobacteriota bacterium]NIO58143.1 hypothetical protein [Acidobacteriota bacterium]NIQ29159.1 hypothetical protein [Acidobacteriota bacterium]NIQ85071.1 hypothetical protein [Acidobacteriota bacterium]